MKSIYCHVWPRGKKMYLNVDGNYYCINSPCSVKWRSVVAKASRTFLFQDLFPTDNREREKVHVLMPPFVGRQYCIGYWEKYFLVRTRIMMLVLLLLHLFLYFRLYDFHFLFSDLPVTQGQMYQVCDFSLKMWALQMTSCSNSVFILSHSVVLNTEFEAKGWIK